MRRWVRWWIDHNVLIVTRRPRRADGGGSLPTVYRVDLSGLPLKAGEQNPRRSGHHGWPPRPNDVLATSDDVLATWPDVPATITHDLNRERPLERPLERKATDVDNVEDRTPMTPDLRLHGHA